MGAYKFYLVRTCVTPKQRCSHRAFGLSRLQNHVVAEKCRGSENCLIWLFQGYCRHLKILMPKKPKQYGKFRHERHSNFTKIRLGSCERYTPIMKWKKSTKAAVGWDQSDRSNMNTLRRTDVFAPWIYKRRSRIQRPRSDELQLHRMPTSIQIMHTSTRRFLQLQL